MLKYVILLVALLLSNQTYASNTEIIVDRTSHTLTLIKNGEIIKQYDVIIGRKTTPTPAFDTTFTTIDINPYWHPTAKSIDEFYKHPELIEHYGVIFDNNNVYAPPSSKNPLGKARLNLKYSLRIIRIHGTSQPELFQTSRRDYSSGCTRVLHIRDLVGELYSGYIDWNRSYTIKLSEPVDVSVR